MGLGNICSIHSWFINRNNSPFGRKGIELINKSKIRTMVFLAVYKPWTCSYSLTLLFPFCSWENQVFGGQVIPPRWCKLVTSRVVTSAGAPPATLWPSLHQSLAMLPQPLPHTGPRVSSVKHRSEGPNLLGPSQHRDAVVLWSSVICDRCILLTDHRAENSDFASQCDWFELPAGCSLLLGRMPEGGTEGGGQAPL